MNTHYATGTVHVSNLDSEDEAREVEELIESALRGAGYYADIDITGYPNPTTDKEPTP